MKVKKKGNWKNGFINFQTDNCQVELNYDVQDWGVPIALQCEKHYFEIRFLFIGLIVL